MSQARFFFISHKGKIDRLNALDELLAMQAKEGFLWLDYSMPSKEELTALIEPFGIHPLSIEDCLDEKQIPKIEDFPQNTFILFNAFGYAEGSVAINEVDVILGKNYLITVNGHGSGDQKSLLELERIIEHDLASVRQGPAFLLHTILDHVVDRKFDVIEALEEDLDKTEDALLKDAAAYDPAGLLDLRRDLMAVRKTLFHEREILVKICRKDCPFIPEKAIFYYRDIYDHLTKFFELTEASRDLVNSLMEMYLSMINNQMARSANATNATVRRLTFITTIFMPLTLLAGIGGMSEWTMMTGQANWKIAYTLFLLGMVVIGGLNYLLLKRIERKKEDSEKTK